MGKPNVNWNVGIAAEKQSTYTSKTVKAGIPFASQVTEPNVKYIIKYDFDLGGENVIMPEDCILEFDGGSLGNGAIEGNNTTVQGYKGILPSLRLLGDYSNESIDLDLLIFSDTDDVSNFLNAFTQNYNTKAINLHGRNFKAKNLEINHSLTINGNGAVISPVHKDSHSFYGLLTCADGNGDLSIHLNGFSVLADDIEHSRDYISGPLFYFNNCKELILENICVDNYKGAYGESEYGLNFNGGILTSFDIRKLSIEKCEFSNCGTFEWIACMPISLHRDEIDVVFDDNYIHDATGATPVFFMCNRLSVCGNRVRNFHYIGSVFNVHGYKAEFRNNDISDSTASSVFDTCEYGGLQKTELGEVAYYSDTVICENNYCSCANGTLLVTWAKHITIHNNTLIGQCLCNCQGSDSLGSSPDESFILPTNKLVSIINNHCVCDSIDTGKTQSYFKNFVRISTVYDVGGEVIIDNNYFFRDTSKLTKMDSPLSVGNIKNLYIRNNTVSGCYNKYDDPADLLFCEVLMTYSQYYPFELKIENVVMKGNNILDAVDKITLFDFNNAGRAGLVWNCTIEDNQCYNSFCIKSATPAAFYDLNISGTNFVISDLFTVFHYTNIEGDPRKSGVLKSGNIYKYNGVPLTVYGDSVQPLGPMSSPGAYQRGTTYSLPNGKYIIISGTWQMLQEDIDTIANMSVGVHKYKNFYINIIDSSVYSNNLYSTVLLKGALGSRPAVPFARTLTFLVTNMSSSGKSIPIFWDGNKWADSDGNEV